jgi:hemerythrin-like domain-containing protein
MNEILSMLRHDHVHFRRLLDALQAESRSFADGESPDFELLEQGLAYMRNYVHAVHHPLEERIIAGMQAGGEDELATQHDELEEQLQTLEVEFRAVHDGGIARRQVLVDALDRLVEAFTRHLDWEDTHFFPLAEAKLARKDWDGIADDLPERLSAALDDVSEDRFAELDRLLEQRGE